MKHLIGMLSAQLPVVVIAFGFSSTLTGQQPPHCAQVLFCLFNQEAAASDSAGVHRYSEDLVRLIVPPEEADLDVEQFANRLAEAEQSARSGKGKLVPEAEVVGAFNDLMSKIGAPASLRTTEPSLRNFREHAASIKAFPALFTSARHGANCNPGEAVFLLYLLISSDGVLREKNVDAALILTQIGDQRNVERGNLGVVGVDGFGLGPDKVSTPSASKALSQFLSDHNQNADLMLLNELARRLDF